METGVSLNYAQMPNSVIMGEPRWWWYTKRGPNHYRKAVSTMAETIMHPELVFAKSAQWIKGSRGHLNTYRCQCGNTFVAQPNDVRKGKHWTCGCARINKTTHGMSKHPLYHVHKSMLARCLNHNNSDYATYGGRGITVCLEWIKDRTTFFQWAIENGWDRGLLIDRINVNGNYEPSNCRFVNISVSNMNKRSYGKLTETDVEKMRSARESGKPIRVIACDFSVSYNSAWKTLNGINHAPGKQWRA
jgi:hypothetical protein